MKKIFLALFLFLLLSSHDLYFKTGHYFMEPDFPGELYLFNGTFDKSENSIDRDRMIGSRIVGPDYDLVPDDDDWYDKNSATFLNFITGRSGTYSAGISTRPRTIELTAEEFFEYLVHDGVLDIVALREKQGKLSHDAVEKYSKHVKTIFQVGDVRSDHYKTYFGYPVEFMPLVNPYEIKKGSELPMQLMQNDAPLQNHLVYFGYRNKFTESSEDLYKQEQSARTDESGMFIIPINHRGIWYVRTINMVESDEEGINYESNWATLTFEIR